MMADMKKKGAVRQLDELKVEKGKSKKVDKKKSRQTNKKASRSSKAVEDESRRLRSPSKTRTKLNKK